MNEDIIFLIIASCFIAIGQTLIYFLFVKPFLKADNEFIKLIKEFKMKGGLK